MHSPKVDVTVSVDGDDVTIENVDIDEAIDVVSAAAEMPGEQITIWVEPIDDLVGEGDE